MTASIPNGTLEGPGCTPLPITITFTKYADPNKVSGTVSFAYAQQDSGDISTLTLAIAPGPSATGSVTSQLDLCASRFRGEANLVENTVSLQASDGVGNSSASTSANFWVAKASTVVTNFRVTRSAVKGAVRAQTRRFGAIAADGRATVWFRPPGDRLFKRLGTSTLDPSGGFQVPTVGRIPPKSLLRVNSFDCHWCKDAYAETRSPSSTGKPTKPKPKPADEPSPTKLRYYLSAGKTEGIAVRTSGRKAVAAFPAVGDRLFCFKGKQRKRPALGGGVMYVGQRMAYVMGRQTNWKTYWFSIEAQPQKTAVFEDPWKANRPYRKTTKPALVKRWGAGAFKACGITR